MATRLRHADGSTTAYTEVPLRRARERNKGNAVSHGLTMDGPFAPTGELLLDVYLDLMQAYEALDKSYLSLPDIDEAEAKLDLFLTDNEYCVFERDSDAYKALMPNRAHLIRLMTLMGYLNSTGGKPDDWREWLKPGFYWE